MSKPKATLRITPVKGGGLLPPDIAEKNVNTVGDDQPDPLWQRALTLGGVVSASSLAGLLVVGVVSFFTAGQFPMPERVPSNGLVLGDTASPEQADAGPLAEPGTTGLSSVVAGGRVDVPAEPGGGGTANASGTERGAVRELSSGLPPSATAEGPSSGNGAARPRAGVGSPSAEVPRLKPVSPVPWLSAPTPSAARG